MGTRQTAATGSVNPMMPERLPNRLMVSSLVVMLACGMHAIVRAQEPSKTVADGVYTDGQAMRGASAYDASCSGCHRPDLGGGTGPALRDQRFARQYADKDLKVLFTKIATTMPRNAAGSLADNVTLDIVAHLLKENGFPAGSQELAVAALDGIRVLPGRPKPPPPVGDFSYVEVVGCLTAGPEHTWMLTQASDPVAATLRQDSGQALRQGSGQALRQGSGQAGSMPPSTDKPLGTQTLRLLDAMAYAPGDHKGHTMYVRGMLMKLPGEQRMTISAFEMVSPTCRE